MFPPTDTCQVNRPLKTEDLLPLLYRDLRRLASSKLRQERVGHTLQPTALVHETFLRLMGRQDNWDSQGHFFAAAATAMRRILIENARRRQIKTRQNTDRPATMSFPSFADDEEAQRMIELDDALQALARIDQSSARIAELRVFTGLTIQEVADSLNLPKTSVYRDWCFARAWLKTQL